MSPRAPIPLTDDVIAAVAKFFHGGAGPSHTEITRVLTRTGYSDGYTYNPSAQGPNQEQGVLQGFTQAMRHPARARDLVEGLLSLLGVAGLIVAGPASDDADRLRRALGSAGWYLTKDGHAQQFGQVELDTGGRGALDGQVEGPEKRRTGPPLQLGTLLVRCYKYVNFDYEREAEPATTAVSGSRRTLGVPSASVTRPHVSPRG